MDLKLKLGNWLLEKASALITKSNIAKYGKQIGRVNEEGSSMYVRRVQKTENQCFKNVRTLVSFDGKPRAYTYSTDTIGGKPFFEGTTETTFLNSNLTPYKISRVERATNCRYVTVSDLASGKTKHTRINKDVSTGNITIDKWQTNRMGALLGSHNVSTVAKI